MSRITGMAYYYKQCGGSYPFDDAMDWRGRKQKKAGRRFRKKLTRELKRGEKQRINYEE